MSGTVGTLGAAIMPKASPVVTKKRGRPRKMDKGSSVVGTEPMELEKRLVSIEPSNSITEYQIDINLDINLRLPVCH